MKYFFRNIDVTKEITYDMAKSLVAIIYSKAEEMLSVEQIILCNGYEIEVKRI